MKIGITGNGMIVERMLEDIAELPVAEGKAICVRPRSREKGEILAERHGLKLYTDYEAFLQSEAFDTVYIGIVNSEHYRYAKLALEAGKHVICEKPFTVSADETKELVRMARERKLFLWEAFKIPYSPIFQAVQGQLDKIGEIKLVQCNYSRVSSRFRQYQEKMVLPAFDPKQAGGCLYDINIYNLHFVTGLFGRPKKVHYYANKGFNGIDTSGTVVLEYERFWAICTGAKDSTSPSYAVIQGTEGCIRAEGPISSARTVELLVGDRTRVLARDEESGTLKGELKAFAAQYDAKDLEGCYEMLEHSILVMEVLEAARKDAGVEFS
ncbi:MAG: Gfo/Idh/MocA family oxidoreductase [Lachnospiraceae bacterium]|nr:Gfo/Idh/MocA family oxidoreductase [Oscillospiraceae bacterium]MDY5540161.1 Gfo/Idh/MocA family oxidoreductase [Lachnospiraceae bacterium]